MDITFKVANHINLFRVKKQMAISIYAEEQKIFPKIPILTEILVK